MKQKVATTFQYPFRHITWFGWLFVCSLYLPSESLACGVDQIKVRGICVSDPVHERIFDLIAYGTQTNGSGIVMATPIGLGTCYRPFSLDRNPCKYYTGAAPWRFGIVSIGGRPNAVELSRSGTKLFVAYPSSFDILDLQGYSVWPNSPAPPNTVGSASEAAPSHRLPSQLYVYASGNRIHVVDDCKIDLSSNGVRVNPCSQDEVNQTYPAFDAKAAALSASGHELLVRPDGSMMVYDSSSQQTRSAGTLPSLPQEVEVIPAPKGEKPDFLVAYRDSDDHFLVIEPGTQSPIAEFSNGLSQSELRVAAQIFACLLFHGDSPDLTKLMKEFEIRTNETAVTRAKRYALGLAQLLTRPDIHETPELGTPSSVQVAAEDWRIRRVRPDPEIYAPVLELAPDEPVLPSSTKIWQIGDADRVSQSKSGAVWQSDWYDRLTPTERLGMTAVHYRTLSYSGSWLIEYWVYYPFDVGVGGHVHDEEHLFVEIDKLTGRPLSVLASAHDFFTPSNLYSSTDVYLAPGALPPTIPLSAFVERGKHAMAPDIDRDTHFTLGRDVNLYREVSQVWGIRDFASITSSHVQAFNSSMMIPRRPSDELASTQYRSYFPRQSNGFQGGTYSLVPFPEAPLFSEQRKNPCRGRGVFTTACGDYRLQSHPDARQPWKIYKPWVYPLGESRWGFVYWGSGLRGYGVVVSPFSINFGLSALIPSLALPGRLVPEFGAIPHRSVLFGLTYEAQNDNLFGWYVGTLLEQNQVPPGHVNNPEFVRRWGWRGGISVVVASYRPGTVRIQVGPVWEGTRGIRPAFEVRVLYTYQASRGRTTFGRETNKLANPGFAGKLFPGEGYPGSPIWTSFIVHTDTRPYTAPPEPGTH